MPEDKTPNPVHTLAQEVASRVESIRAKSADDVQSYANQLQHCRNMRQNLNNLDDEIMRLARSYYDALQALEAEAYVLEELQGFAQKVEEFAPLAEEISSHLRVRHLFYIDERAKQVTLKIQETLGS